MLCLSSERWAHPPPAQADVAPWPWLAHRAAENPFNRRRASTAGGPLSCWLPGAAVEAEHGPELLGGVHMGEGLIGDVDADGPTDRLPAVARVPIEEPVRWSGCPHVGVVALVGG